MPGQNQQQRCLANTVGTDQPYLAVVGDADADAAEQVEVAKGLAEVAGV